MYRLKFRTMFSTTLRCTFCSTIFPPHKSFHLKKPFSSSSASQQEALLHHQCWSGLGNWRSSPLNHSRFWGPNGPQAPILFEETRESVDLCSCSSLAEMGALVLSTADPLMKSKLSHLAFTRWFQEGLPIGVFQPPQKPAHPLKPKLVSPKEIPSPKNLGIPLNAYMLHNLAHVELNAIDLAWDTVVRFSPHLELLGHGFFIDFAHVADDESRHFAWCLQRLSELGFSYGDMPAHNLLWRECDKTSDNVAARLAAIPLVQEARGLDAGPRLVKKLIGFGDHRTSNIVARIADEEVAHVAVGLLQLVSTGFSLFAKKWDASLPLLLKDKATNIYRAPKYGPFSSPKIFKDLLKEYGVELKGPFNHSARDEAGIPREWYDPQILGEEEKQTNLSEVYDRLSYIVSMEQKNSSLDRPQGYDCLDNELDK